MISYCAKKMIADFDSSRFHSGFMLYGKYSRKDVCRILNWDKIEESCVLCRIDRAYNRHSYCSSEKDLWMCNNDRNKHN